MYKKALILFLALFTMISASLAAQSTVTVLEGKKALLINNKNIPDVSDVSYDVSTGTIQVGNFKDGPVMFYNTNVISGVIKIKASNDDITRAIKPSQPFLVEYLVSNNEKVVCTQFQNCELISVSNESGPGKNATKVYRFKANKVTIN